MQRMLEEVVSLLASGEAEMNQRPLRGETTLEALQRAYLQTQYRARALRICEGLDRACDLAPARMKQDALVLTNYYLRQIAAK